MEVFIVVFILVVDIVVTGDVVSVDVDKSVRVTGELVVFAVDIAVIGDVL